MTEIGNLVVGLLLLLLLLHLLLGLREVPPIAPGCRELGTVGHLGHGAELARALVPGHPKGRSSTGVAIRPVDAEAVVHPLEVEVHLLEDGVLGPVPVLVDGHGVGDGLHVQQVVDDGVP